MNMAQACIDYRAAHDLTQAELAARLNVHRQTILNVEAGRNISKITEAKLRRIIEEG